MRELLFCPAAWVAWFEFAREQAAALESAFEGDVDSRARWLEADPRSCWLAKPAFQVPILIEYEDVGGKGIVRGEGSPWHHVLFVACARQPVA